jgi:hypothetical protein
VDLMYEGGLTTCATGEHTASHGDYAGRGKATPAVRAEKKKIPGRDSVRPVAEWIASKAGRHKFPGDARGAAGPILEKWAPGCGR